MLWSAISKFNSGLILGLLPAHERRQYFVMAFLIGWVQAWNQPWNLYFASFIYHLILIKQTSKKIILQWYSQWYYIKHSSVQFSCLIGLAWLLHISIWLLALKVKHKWYTTCYGLAIWGYQLVQGQTGYDTYIKNMIDLVPIIMMYVVIFLEQQEVGIICVLHHQN